VGNALELFSDDFDFFVELQDVFNLIGNLLQIGQQRLEQLLRQCSSFLRYEQADHVKDGELSGKCLGARYADFRARVCVGTSMRCSRDGRAHDVTYADDGSAPLLGEL